MRFEWDEKKNLVNQSKHNLSFETAQDVFSDPLHVSKPDQVVDGELRWLTVGIVGALALIVVAHTFRDEDGEDVVRIISARKASRQERRDYENH